MLLLEVLMRGGAVGVFLALALVMARPPLTPARITGVLFSLAAVGHTLTQYAPIRETFSYMLAPAWAFSVMGAGLFWAFATELFEDRPRLAPIRLAPAAGLAILGVGILIAGATVRPALLLTHNLASAALMAHVLFVIWKGWQADLVESRRRLRGPILGAAALYAVSVISVQIAEVAWGPATFLSPLAAFVLLLLGLAGLGMLAQADPDLFAVAAAVPVQVQVKATPVSPGGSSEETKLAAKLDQLMRTERVYRDEQLSIGALSSKVGVPEYRLRRLINQQLGYRNFNAYLNGWRLADAKQALADRTQAEVPISTIALDAGFQSLGPFNRAFKADTGLTPSEFRAQAALPGAPVTT